MAQGPGDQTPISRLESQVEVGLGDSEETLARHRQSLRETQQDTQRMGRAAEQMGEQIAASTEDIRRASEALKVEQDRLKGLREYSAGTTARGGPGIPQIDEEIKRSEERINQLKTQLGVTADAAVQSNAKMRQSFLSTVSSVDDLRTHLSTLQQMQARGAGQGVVTIGLEQEISKSKSLLASLDQQTRTTARDMSQNFLATATSIDVIRQRLQALQEMQARGLAGGTITRGLPEEIARTERVLKQVDDALGQHQNKLSGASATYNIARSAVNTLNTEITRMAGVSIPGLGQMEGVAAGLAERFIGLGAAGTLATFGILAAGTAAVTTGLSMTILGADVQEAVAKIATSSNVTLQVAHDQEVAFRGIRSGGVETAEAYANIAGMLRTYNGQALTTAQATAFMATAQDGATATGQRLLHVTEGFARALVATHTPIAQSNELMNVLYVTSLNTGVSISQLGLAAARMVERTGAAAPSVRELGIALTLAAQAGAQGQEGLEPVDNLIRNLANNSPKARQDLEGLGVTVAKNSRGQIELGQTLLNLKAAYDSLGSDTQRYALAQELAGQGAPVLQAMLKLTAQDIKNVAASYDDSNRFSKDAETHAQTLGGRLGILSQQAKDAAGGVGEQFAGGLVRAGDAMDRLGGRIQAGIRLWQEWQRARDIATHGGEFDRAMDVARRGPTAGVSPLFGSQEEMDSSKARENIQATLRLLQEEADVRTAAAAAANRSGIDVEGLQNQQQFLSGLTTEAQRLHLAMVAVTAPENTPGGADQRKAINDYLAALTQVEAGIRQAYDPANPQQMADRLARLSALSLQYRDAVGDLSKTNSDADRERANNIKSEIDLLNVQINQENTKHQQDQKDASFKRQQDAEAARRAKELRDADPLLGITQGLSRDRQDLIGVAGQVMADLNKTIELRGQQGARAAGEAFGVEASKWGEQLEKAGVQSWQDSFDRLVDLGRVAVVTGSPEIIQAIHDLLAEGETTIRDANIGKAMADAMAKANSQMLEQQARVDDQLLRAQVTGAASRADALQQEVNREYDVWSSRQIDRLETADRNGRELQRIGEQWGREDLDRTEVRARAKADLELTSNRAAMDRARDQARALKNLADDQVRAQADLTRQRAREEKDAEYEHDKRLKEIQRRGGDPASVSTAINEENLSFQQAIKDRTRKREQDDAEAAIKRSQQVADAGRRQYEQVSDAARRAGETADDLLRRQGNEANDIAKARTRQLQSRTDQQTDAQWLKDQRINYEQQFFTDAETKAKQKLANDIARINARYQHEEVRAAAASDAIQLKRAHDEDIAAIKAQERFGAITPEQSTEQQNAVDETFTARNIALQARLRQREQQIDQALAQQIAGRERYAPGFAPQNVPFEQTNQFVPPTPGFSRSDFGGNLFAANEGKSRSWLVDFMNGTRGNEPIPVILLDQQIQDLADAANNQPPIEMDGNVVEDVQSRIRRQRNLSRTLG